MKREITLGALTGLLFGSSLLAPAAVHRSEASVPAKKPTQAALALPKLPPESPLSDYQLINERDLFQPPLSAKPPVLKPVMTVPNFNFPTPWVSPTEGWTYAGYVTIDGVTQAILQQPEGEALLLKQGESFLGGTLEEITPQQVRISFGEKETYLGKSDVYNAAPEALGGKRKGGAAAGRTRPAGAARLQPYNRTANPAGGNAASPRVAAPLRPDQQRIQEQADQLRALWEARRRARQDALQQPPVPASNPGP